MIKNGVQADEIPGAVWQKANASVGNGNCIEVAKLPEGGVGMRNSRFPEGPVLVFTKGEVAAFFDGVSKMEFDHLTA
ncbi:DUF397 domain-containing protein [Streptomyces olivaceoviridis]|uniref:DUF397 domain-containing protein n=1 Tax=Streptomyces olivaceoviridis TaxID=1921 RepID=UPI0036881028